MNIISQDGTFGTCWAIGGLTISVHAPPMSLVDAGFKEDFWAQWVSLHVEYLKTYYSVDSGFSAIKYDSFYAK